MTALSLASRLLVMALMLLANAFFAAAEVSLVSARRSRLHVLAAQNDRGALAALTLLADRERLLTVTQVGITLASLSLGWAGAELVFALLLNLVSPIEASPLGSPATAWVLRVLSLIGTFGLLTLAHVVLGGVVPRTFGAGQSDRVAVLLAPGLLLFSRLAEPLLRLAEVGKRRLSRPLQNPPADTAADDALEEVRFLVSAGISETRIPEVERAAIQHLLDLNEYVTREIMVPRTAMVSLPVTAPLEDVLGVVLEHQFSRYPVYEGSVERIIGILHVKDLLGTWEARRYANAKRRPPPPFRLAALLRKPMVVPETKPVGQLLGGLRDSHTQMALVVDEFGTISGIVTLEDAMEQVFGEIEDEHDERRLPPTVSGPLELEGSTLIRDLELRYGLTLPSEAGFETLAGFLLYRLGRIPQPGEVVVHGERRFTVLQMERNRIALVRVERVQTAA